MLPTQEQQDKRNLNPPHHGKLQDEAEDERKVSFPIFLPCLRHYAPSSYSPKNQNQKPSCIKKGMSLLPYNAAKFYIIVSEDAGQDCFGKYFYTHFCPKQ